MEYFELKQDYWIARWLQKPSMKEIKSGEKNIKRRNTVIMIGIAETISDRIIKEYIKQRKMCNMYGRECTDFDRIGEKMELPRAIVLLILERKGLINRAKVRNK
jgi:hypothetical protein